MRTLASRRLFPTWQASAQARQYLLAYNGTAGATLSGYGIGLAESWDGIAWTKITTSQPAIAPTNGAWDSVDVKAPSLLKYASGDYRLWYEGSTGGASATFQIGLATSSNGLVWTKSSSNPVVPTGSAGAWDSNTIRFPFVLHEPSDSTYPLKMWYGGASSGTEALGIGTAYSTDGVSWTKSSSNPVLSVGATYDAAAVYPEGVINLSGTYYLFYSGRPTTGVDGAGTSGDQVCVATSTNWQGAYTKSGSNPLLSPSTALEALTSNLNGGGVTVNVASTAAFHAGEPCLLIDSTDTQADVYIETINSSTQMTLKAPGNTGYAWTTANSATIRSYYYGSVDGRNVLPATGGGYVMYLAPFQQFAGSPGSERAAAATSSSLISGWAFDYARGFVLPLGPSWDAVSCENPSVIVE